MARLRERADQDEYAEAWWDWNGEEWEEQMAESGWAVMSEGDPAGDRMALLAEARWVPVRHLGTIPSRLWDASTPSTVGMAR